MNDTDRSFCTGDCSVQLTGHSVVLGTVPVSQPIFSRSLFKYCIVTVKPSESYQIGYQILR